MIFDVMNFVVLVISISELVGMCILGIFDVVILFVVVDLGVVL